MSINKVYMNLKTVYNWYEDNNAEFVYKKLKKADSIQYTPNYIIDELLKLRNNKIEFIKTLEFAYYSDSLMIGKLNAFEKYLEKKEAGQIIITSKELEDRILEDKKKLNDHFL